MPHICLLLSFAAASAIDLLAPLGTELLERVDRLTFTFNTERDGVPKSRRTWTWRPADGTVTPRVIRPGPSYAGLRIVREGLSGDDTIIIDGLVRARPGAKVDPQPGEIKLAAAN